MSEYKTSDLARFARNGPCRFRHYWGPWEYLRHESEKHIAGFLNVDITNAMEKLIALKEGK
jgi:hypothetical protein